MGVEPARVKLRRKSRFGVSLRVCSMRSVTWSSVSSRLAPGQAAWTIIVLKVNAGSSWRPRRKYDIRPAATVISMQYTTKERWFSAHSERLNRIISPLPAGGPFAQDVEPEPLQSRRCLPYRAHWRSRRLRDYGEVLRHCAAIRRGWADRPAKRQGGGFFLVGAVAGFSL